MLEIKDLPPCPDCSISSWAPGSGIGKAGSLLQGWRCCGCEAKATYCSDAGANCLVVGDGKEVERWLNTVVEMVFSARAWERAMEQSKHADLLRPGVIAECGFDYRDLRPEDRTQIRRDAWGEAWGNADQLRPLQYTNPNPPDLPQIPLCVMAWVVHFSYATNTTILKAQDHAASWLLPVPPHPGKARQMAEYAALFKELSTELGQKLKPKQIENGYSTDEGDFSPWFEFGLAGLDIIIKLGRRRSVWSVQCYGGRGWLSNRWRELSMRDKVTFSEQVGQPLEIHAHDYTHLLEYCWAACRG